MTYSFRDLWKVAWPILLSLVMEQMLGMTDTAFLGRVGEIELGAAALAGVFYTVLFIRACIFCFFWQFFFAYSLNSSRVP